MTATNFDRSLKLVLVNEGGNDDDPEDHGGRTSRGITQREYDAYCRLHGLPRGDVWQAPQALISDIYHGTYWEPYADWMPTPIDYMYFDMAVNAGPHRALVLMQDALNIIDDGIMGPVTKEAILNADPSKFIQDFTAQKRRFYISIAGGSQRKYLRGWLNRTNDVRSAANAMLRT
jgi:lysozyme family protein